MTDYWHDILKAPLGTWVLVTVAGRARGAFEIACNVDGVWVKKVGGMLVDMGNFGEPTHYHHLEDPPQYET